MHKLEVKTKLSFAALVAALLVVAVALSACGKPRVSVRTGERVYCVYGEVLKNTVRTIQVPADEAKRYSVKRSTILCEKHRRLTEQYDQAQDALVRGDTTAAEKLLASIVTLEPTFRKASEQIRVIRSGKTPAPDLSSPGSPTSNPSSGGSSGGGSSGGGNSSPPPKPEGPSASLSGYVPDSIPGFTARPILAEDFSLTREYAPTDTTHILQLVITAEQYRDAAAAASADSRARMSYGQDGETIKIGSRTVWIGTDGRNTAGVIVREGSVVAIMEMAVTSRDPAGIKADLRSAATSVLE